MKDRLAGGYTTLPQFPQPTIPTPTGGGTTTYPTPGRPPIPENRLPMADPYAWRKPGALWW